VSPFRFDLSSTSGTFYGSLPVPENRFSILHIPTKSGLNYMSSGTPSLLPFQSPKDCLHLRCKTSLRRADGYHHIRTKGIESLWYLKAARDSRCRLGAHGVARVLSRSVHRARSNLRRRGLVGIYTVGRITQEIAEVVKRNCSQESKVHSAHVTQRMANAGAEASPVRMSPSSLSII
jgi:hypothetical protein